MANCKKEIAGVKQILLFTNKDVLYNFPDVSNETEVNITVNSEGSVIINDVNQYPKWERTSGQSGNYKQNYSDEFSFIVHGIENDVPDIIKDLRNNRLGYVCIINTTENDDFVFPTPVFLNKENTKQIDSHSWNISLSYRVPTFQNYYTALNTTLN